MTKIIAVIGLEFVFRPRMSRTEIVELSSLVQYYL